MDTTILLVIFPLYMYCVSSVIATPEVTEPDSNGKIYTYIGADVTMKCLDRSPLEWYRKGVKLEPSSLPSGISINTESKAEGKQETILRISPVKIEHEGVYNCKDVNEDSGEITVHIIDPTPVPATVDSPGGNVELSCAVSNVEASPSTYEVTWSKDDAIIYDSDDKYEHQDNNTLVIKNVKYPGDLGEYLCKFTFTNEGELEVKVVLSGKPFVHPLHSDKSRVLKKGEDLRLNCKADGHPTPVLYWKLEDNYISDENPRIILGENNSTLDIDNLEYSDRGNYYCIALSSNLSSNSTVMIRVKDPLAVVWPLIGIVIEVILLALIIGLWEWRKRKSMSERDEKTEEAIPLAETSYAQSGARQRKA